MRVHGYLLAVLIGTLALSPLTSFAGKKSKSPAACQSGEYTCVRVKRGQSWKSLFPDERERGIVMRINHKNGALWAGQLIKIPNDLAYADLLDYSPFPRQIDPPEEKMVVYDPARHAWAAYDSSGLLVRWGPATGGKDWCADEGATCRTKEGQFRIYSMGSSRCVSSKYPKPEGGAPMPYCMFFHGGQAFHGSPGGVRKAHLSHGCVRMFVSDAEWLRYEFVDPPDEYNSYRGTKVLVLPYHNKS